MDKATFDDYINTRYNKQMEYYSKASAKNQKGYKRFQWILIILSALTPVLAALSGRSFKFNDVSYVLDLQMVVVIISAIVAILTTALKTFNYQELWINYRSTYEKLKPEIHYYKFGIGPYAATSIDKESLFVSRVETILDTEHTMWPPAKKLQDQQTKSQANKDEQTQQNINP